VDQAFDHLRFLESAGMALVPPTSLERHEEYLAFVAGVESLPTAEAVEVEWKGRSWPVYFDQAIVFAISPLGLIVDGRSPDPKVACFERYRAWAQAAGLSHRAGKPGFEGLIMADDHFVLFVEDRGAFLLMSIQIRDDL